MTKNVNIIGDIDEDTFRMFVEETIDAEADKFVVLLTSHGGDAQVGLAFHDYIQGMVKVGCKVEIRAHGCVDSAAVVVLSAGSKRIMSRNCRLFLHEEYSEVEEGSFTDSVSVQERKVAQARREEDQWDFVLEQDTGTKAEVWRRLHQDETYLTAEECLEYGIVDEVV